MNWFISDNFSQFSFILSFLPALWPLDTTHFCSCAKCCYITSAPQSSFTCSSVENSISNECIVSFLQDRIYSLSRISFSITWARIFLNEPLPRRLLYIYFMDNEHIMPHIMPMLQEQNTASKVNFHSLFGAFRVELINRNIAWTVRISLSQTQRKK